MLPKELIEQQNNMENNQQSKTYSLRDLSLASFLLASEQVTLVTVERKNDHIVVFHFSDPEKSRALADAYWSDNPPFIPARKLFGCQRDLKDLIFSGGSG